MSPTTKSAEGASLSVDPLATRQSEHREMLGQLAEFWRDIADSSLDVESLLCRYVDLGSELVRREPAIFKETVEQLLEAASHMEEECALAFLEQGVSSQTFTFQARFDELLRPTALDLSREFACHINKASLLLSIPDRILIPPSMREPRHCANENDPFNRKHVFFATDAIDRLSTFLVGHAFLRSPEELSGAWPQPEGDPWSMNLATAWACEPTGQLFSREFMVAVASPDYSRPGVRLSTHDVESPVRRYSESVKLVIVGEPIQVDLIKIPVTVLLPSQRLEFERAALSYSTDFSTDPRGPFQFDLTRHADFEYPKQCALTRHAELTIKLALLELWEAKFASKAPSN